MKHFSKKLLGITLSVAMVLSMIPFTAFPSQAATNLEGGLEGQDADVFTALGFDTSELPEGYEPDTTDNPYGRDKIPGNQVFELAVAGASGSREYGKNDNSVEPTTISGVPGGTGTGMEMMASAAGDFDGDGLAGEIIYVGYTSEIGIDPVDGGDQRYTPVDLSLRIYNGRTGGFGPMKKIGSVHPGFSSDLNNYIYAVSEYQWLNLLQVTAGDYDGDGISEIAVYVAENGRPRVEVYKYQKKSDSRPGDWIDIQNWGRVWSHPLSGEYVPNMVSLVSGDLNRDGVDDLGISHGRAMTLTSSNGEAEASRAVILWGDRNKMLQTSSPLDLNQEKFGEQVRVSLITGDLDQDGTPELIATGQPLSNFNRPSEYFSAVNKTVNYGNAERTAITYLYDETLGLTINSSELFEPLKGTYQTVKDSNGNPHTTWSEGNGYDSEYWSMPAMRTNSAVFKPAGADYAFLYLDSCLYECVEGKLSLKGELDEKYDGEHSFKLDNQNWGARFAEGQSPYAEYGAAAADINGNGEQILVVNSVGAYTYVRLGESDGYYYDQYAVVSGNGKGELTATISSPEKNTDTYQGQALTFLDNDTDTVIMEYTGEHYLTYSDPKILAIIAAAPYFEDVDEATGYEFAGNNTNSWGLTHGDSHSTSVTVDFAVGGQGSHELNGAGFNLGIEWSADVTLSYEKSWTDSHEYTMTFGTYGDQDAIAFYSIPTENYIYRIKTPDGKGGYTEELKPVMKSYQPAYQVLTLDYYESIRKDFSSVLPAVKGVAIKSKPGDPSSYPSSYNEFDKDDIIVKWDQDAAGVGYGNGSITQSISVSHEEETSYSLGAEIAFQLGGGSKVQFDVGQSGFENQWGGHFSLGTAGGWADTSMKGTTIEAEVANMPVEFQDYGYYFNWKLFSYYYNFGDTGNERKLEFNTEDENEEDFSLEELRDIGMATNARVPVITFAVSDVAKPPLLPDDFQQDYDRTTSDTNVLTWTYDKPVTNFIVYKQFDFPVGGGLQEVARIQPGDSNHYRIKYDEDGDPYKEFFFADTNLTPYTEYQYAIQVERLDPVPPLSTPSALVTARTKSENGYPKTIIEESDDEQDGKLQVYPDKNAYLTAKVTGPEGETIGNYYSVAQYQWQKKDKGAWKDVDGETNKTLTFASAGADTKGEYRCRVNVITKSGNEAITAYSDSVELVHAKRTSYMKEVSVTDVAGGGVQLYAEVGNAHKDSASVPGGTVTFTLQSNNSGQTYQYTAPLSASGTVTAVLDDTLPEGMYSAKAYYSGSYIFKACTGETLYLSQRGTGYDIDLPGSVTYGDQAEIVFREVSKSGGITTTEDMDAGAITMFRAAPLSRASLSGAVEYKEGTQTKAGTKYRYQDKDGINWYFTAPVKGVPAFDVTNGYVTFGNDLSDRILTVDGFNTEGQYLLQEGTEVGLYLISMKKSADGTASDTAYGAIEVLARPVTLQIPTNLSEGESTDPAKDILFRDLSLIAGSWADCDIDKDTGDYSFANDTIRPLYYNTAGKEFKGDKVREFCGAYTVIGTAKLPNYRITWRSGQLTVLGAANDVNIGVRNFDGLNVGRVYMMSPEIGVATGPLGGTGALKKRIQAGVRMLFSAQPDDGYEIYDWYINGVAQNNKNNTIAYTMLAENTTVEVQYEIKQNTFTFGIAGDENGGTLTCSDASLNSGSVVRRNSTFTFTAEAREGYHFKEWRYTEQGLGTAYYDEDKGKDSSTFDFVMPNIGCSLYAVFERDGYVFNYIDGNNPRGLTATYENEEGKTVTARSGSIIKGGTEITVAPAAGYIWDSEWQYASTGTQGTADYGEGKGTYTLTLNQDTTVYGWTKQEVYDLKLGYGLARTSQQVPDAAITYYIGDQEAVFTCEEYLKGGGDGQDESGHKVLKNIPGGTTVMVTVDVPGWVDLKGWTANETRITASEEKPGLLVASIRAGDTVEKNKSYSYLADGVVRYFTSPVKGTAEWSGDRVTIYSSSVKYTIPALNEDETLTVYLKEKPVHTVTLKDISDKGSNEGKYEYTLPEGGFQGATANTVKVHDGDEFTLRVIPNAGKTVSYWKTTPEKGETVTRPATSLRYTIPAISMDFDFEPVFSTTTYNLISWPTISESRNGLTLNPESGFISSVASGEDFKFKLSGDSASLIDKVYANGNEFTATSNQVGGTTYRYDSTTGVYSIAHVTGNQEITVGLKPVGVTVNGVDISALTGVGWTYDSGEQLLTLTRSGLTLSGENSQELAPDLRILAGGDAGSMTLKNLKVTSAASEPVLQTAGEIIVTVTDHNALKGTKVMRNSVFLAEQNLTLRGNGRLGVDSKTGDERNVYAFRAKLDLTITGNTIIDIRADGSYSKGLKVADTLTVGAKDSPASPELRVSSQQYGISTTRINQFGGEISVRTTGSGTSVGAINCYDGILEVSSEKGSVFANSYFDWQTTAADKLFAYYEDGYMLRSSLKNESAYSTHSKLAKKYSLGLLDVVLMDPMFSLFDKYDYLRLSPLTGGAENDAMTLSVKHGGKTYSRTLDEANSIYYIDVSDENTTELKMLPWNDPNTDVHYAWYQDESRRTFDTDDIVVAEYVGTKSGSFNLHLNAMKFEQHTDSFNNDEPRPVMEGENSVGWFYHLTPATGQYDYTISGSMEALVGSESRGTIYGDGTPCHGKYSGQKSDSVRSLTLSNLTHVNLVAGGYPIYLEGNNYLIGSEISLCPLQGVEDTLDLRGSGTLTISSHSDPAILAKNIKLTDIGGLILFSGVKALKNVESVKYFNGEGDAAVELPYGLGWLEDAGSMAGDASTQDSMNCTTDAKYVKFYSTSTDAEAAPEKLVYDKSSESHSVNQVNLTPPAVMGKIHRFTPGAKGSRAELYKGTRKEKELVKDKDYAYEGTNGVIGELAMKYGSDNLKGLEIGEYTVRVYFEDEDTSDSTYFTLDIPLMVTDIEHVSGGLAAKADAKILTRGSSANITTEFTGTTPKVYQWTLVDSTGTEVSEITGISPVFNGSQATVTVNDNAGNGTFKVKVTAYADSAMAQELGEASVDLKVVPKAESITVSCEGETPSGDGSYMLNHNTLDGNPKAPWEFSAAVGMDDKSDADPAKIRWTLQGAVKNGTGIGPDGRLAIHPNETGLLNSGYMILTAIYTNEDGTKLEKPIKIRLSEDAIVGFNPGEAATGGTIGSDAVANPAGTPVPKGTEVTFRANPAPEYEVDTWYINGRPVEDGVEGNTITFTTEKLGRYNVGADFTGAKICNVRFGQEGPGALTAETSAGTLTTGESVAKGTDVTFTAVPDTYAKVAKWTVTIDGEEQTGYGTHTDNTLTLKNVKDAVEVKVLFEVPERTVTVTAGEHGKVTFLVNGLILLEPAVPDDTGKYTIKARADQPVTALAVPDDNYSVEGWSGLKNATASDAICTIPAGLEDAAAAVTFKTQPTRKVSVYANSFENGWGDVEVGTDTVAMSGSKEYTVPEGGSMTLTAKPDGGSTLYDWEVSPGSYRDYSEDGNELTLKNVTEDVTVKATFRRGSNELSLEKKGDGSLTAKYDLTLPDGVNLENGTLTANEGRKLRSGTVAEITVAAGSGQIPASFTVNGEDRMAELKKVSGEAKYTYSIPALTEDTKISVVFEGLVQHTVTGHGDYTVEVKDDDNDPPAVTYKKVGSVAITEYGKGNEFNEEVTGSDPQQVKVVPNTPVELSFEPEEGYLVDTGALKDGVQDILDAAESEATFSFKQSAKGTILRIEGIDKDLDFSGLEDPFREKRAEEEYITLSLSAGDHGTLTVTNEAESVQYMNGAKVLKETKVSYKALPDEHYGAVVTVNSQEAETEGTLELTEDTTIDAAFSKAEYEVSVSILGKGSGSVTINGKVYGPGKYWFGKDEELTITAAADEDSVTDSFQVDGSSIPEGTAAVKVDKDISVLASFSNAMRPVTYNVPKNGSLQILDANGETVGNGELRKIGEKLYVVATPEKHYDTETLTVGGTDLTANYFLVDELRGNDVRCEFTRSEISVSWSNKYCTIDTQLMPDGESIINGQFVPVGSDIKFVVTPQSGNYSEETFVVSGSEPAENGWYPAEQKDIVAKAVYKFTGEAPDPGPIVPLGVSVSWFNTGCTIAAELADGTALENGQKLLPGSKVKFSVTPKSSSHKEESFTVLGASKDEEGYYVVGEEPVVASAVYSAPAGDSGGPSMPDGTYAVIIDAEDGGTVDVSVKGKAVSSGDEVDLGSKLIIQAKPDAGSKLKSLTVNGVDFKNGEEYVVYANTLIKAVFEKAETVTGLPCYRDDKGNTVFPGFSYDRNGDGVFSEDEYIVPEGVEVFFRENHKHFEDMPGNWADEYIQFVGDREIFQGVTDTLFDPEGKVTRAMYVTVVGRLYERSLGTINGGTAQKFTDCNYDSWYGKYVDWAAATGVITGYDETTFGPNDYVTREQMAAILTRFAKLMKIDTTAVGTVSFTDSDDISGYAVDSVRYCVDKGIITGYDDGRFAPRDNATRAQIAAVIVRYIESVLAK